MLDLIGFWGGVTVFTFLFVLPILALVPVIGDKLIKDISNGESINGFSKNVYSIGLDKISIKNNVICRLGDVMAITLTVLSFVIIFIAIIVSFKEETSIIYIVSKASTFLSTPVSYLVVILLVYTAMCIVGKKLYKLTKLVNRLLEKEGEK